MTGNMTAQLFKLHVGTSFRVKNNHHVLFLARVDQHLADNDGQCQSFNVIFRGVPGDVLHEGLHCLETGNGTSFELYLMPIHTHSGDRQDYQAVFN